ncbi:hypothetical protein J4446_00100 [Candidatus Woesearchaeota archaeon]|nr:hypothetical protein [Candidatus Woesearchaeota archaeon]
MKSQSSTEFMIFVGIAIFVLMLYFGVSNHYLNLTLKEREVITGQDLARQLKNEINLAARVEDNYQRIFQLPYLVVNKNFNVTFNIREVVVNIDNDEYVELLAADVGNEITFSAGDAFTIRKTNDVVSIT